MDEMTVGAKKRELHQLLEKARTIAAAIAGSDYIRPAEQRKFRAILHALETLEGTVW